MKAVIFAGGNIGNYEKVRKCLEGSSLIICADSGVEHALNMGIVPDLLVGDMDSISPASLEKVNKLGIKRKDFPSEKDCTDTELALDMAMEKGADEAVILGAIGDRPDHSLANIFLMVSFKKLGLEVKLADGNWEMFLIDSPVEIRGRKGDILSLIPISSEVCGVETRSLYYPLKGETLYMGPARGVSNIFLENTVRVGIKQGLLLAVRYSGDEL